MNSKEEKDKKILLVIVIIGLIGLGIYKFFFENKQKEEIVDTETIELVSNPSEFYTVSSCVSKYLNYLSTDDTESILKLLSNQYKKDNSITQSNIYTYINKLNNLYSFSPKKMYVQRLGVNIYKYYVQGLTSMETIDGNHDGDIFYIIVILDKEHGTFAIEPYSGNVF